MAALGLVVLAVSLVALGQPRSHSAPAGPTKPPRPASPGSVSVSVPRSPQPSSASGPGTPTGIPASSSASATDAKLPLVVLNNTTVTGLAAQAAASFRAGGWTVTSDGNYQNNVVSTCAYYDPSVVGAQAAAQALQVQFPGIKRVQPKFSGLPAGPIVVVLTPGYS